MTFIDSALKLLRRPIASTGEPPRRRRGEPTDTDVATDEELTAALQQLAAERQAAEALLNGAAERREELLALPGTDDQIIDLARSIDRAQLVLERLDRLEPDLIRRRGEIRFNSRGAAWEADRDAAAIEFAAFAAEIEAYGAARARWAGVYSSLAANWPDSPAIMPRMPALDGTDQSYTAQLEAFRQRVIVLAQPAHPAFYSLANAVAWTQRYGQAPPDCPPEWLDEIERALSGEAEIRWLVDTLDREGRPVAKGTKVTMPYELAEKAVRSGRASYH